MALATPLKRSLRVALVGAGPASLTLAAILRHRSKIDSLPITLTTFEATPSLRHAGGTLDLHPQTGQAALKEAGLWTQFVKHARPESDVDKIVDIGGEVLWDENVETPQEKTEEELFDGRPEIDRAALMKILSESLPDGTIRYSKKVTQVAPNAETAHKYDIHFADSSQETAFDLVVGGDGAWSKVRHLLTDAKPRYSGISLVEVWHNNVRSNPWLANYTGAGNCFAFGEGAAVMSQRQGDGSQRTYAALRVPEDFIETCGIDWNNWVSAREALVTRYFAHAGADLQRIILESKDYLTPRALYELPVGLTWESRPGVTLIGDAAHLMTPFAGVGVNVGMTDALVLAGEIVAACKGEKTLEAAVKDYETEMFPRAEENAQKTARGKEGHFREGGSKRLADMLRAHYEGQLQDGKMSEL